MKYIIDVPNQDYSYDEMLHTLKLKFYDDNLSCEVILDAEPYTEPDRECIEDEVWELADYMCRMSQTEKSRCFGFSYPSEVTTNLTYQEAKSMFEKWMKSENEIHVGDEVEYESCGEVVKFIVTGVNGSRVYGFKSPCEYDDVGDYCDIDGLHKTGRHFPEVAELLEKMRGEEE